MKSNQRSGRGILLGCLLAAAAIGQVQAAPYVVGLQGQQIVGTAIRATTDATIILTTAQGQQSFAKGQYQKAVADRPPEMDKAIQLVQAKQYDAAIKLLEGIIAQYKFLGWDDTARAYLPKLYIQKGDYPSALAAYDKLFALSPKSKEVPEIQWAYRDALLGAKQYEKLEQELKNVVATGARPDAARAQIMRGDCKVAQGQLEGAVLDYLRTVVLFESETDSQPEALYKAASALEQLRDARAKTFYATLRDKYGSSEWAAKAQGK